MTETEYSRFHISAQPAPHLAGHPNRFLVRVGRLDLARHLIREVFHQKGNMAVVTSRPCMYGVFSGPIGGFAPRPHLCVGCLRCIMEYPDFVLVRPNPARLQLGDSYLSPDQVDTILYEASSGRVPVKGAGYRGAFAGEGWDGMWTDMSEIVRPTRDGIHGRETISTAVDLGTTPDFLALDSDGRPTGEVPRAISLEVPWVFDLPPASALSETLIRAYVRSAEAVNSLVVLPMDWIRRLRLDSQSVVPLLRPSDREALASFSCPPRLIELDGYDSDLAARWGELFPQSLLFVRTPMDAGILSLVDRGLRLFHLTADYHGRTPVGFAIQSLRAIHDTLVARGVREQVTLIGSGGIAAAEHVPKAIICGLDAVGLDTALLIALQGRFVGEVADPATARIAMPRLKLGWATQRLINLSASWRDQLLEILGAMGLREVRRLRGEIGRSMFNDELEQEAFSGIEGYEAAHVPTRR